MRLNFFYVVGPGSGVSRLDGNRKGLMTRTYSTSRSNGGRIGRGVSTDSGRKPLIHRSYDRRPTK